MKVIYLLRHGAYDEGSDVLNERGIKQTNVVIAHLDSVVVHPVLISSQGPRAKQTAAMLAEHFSADFEEVDYLEKPMEGQRIDTGVLLKRMRGVGGTHPVVFVTNGEFIHQFVTNLAREWGVPSGLKSLVKGEVMLGAVLGKSIEVSYF